MKIPTDIGEAAELMNKLRVALQLVLDQVDYTAKACTPTEMVGACLSTRVLDIAHQALEDTQE
jgi:hypothetical protein